MLLTPDLIQVNFLELIILFNIHKIQVDFWVITTKNLIVKWKQLKNSVAMGLKNGTGHNKSTFKAQLPN